MTTVVLVTALSACGNSKEDASSKYTDDASQASDFLLGTDQQQKVQTFLQAAMQEQVRRCMNDAGYEYEVDDRTKVSATPPPPVDKQPDVLERQRNGYGLYESFVSQSRVSGVDTDNGGEKGSKPANDVYFDSLPDNEKEPYSRALSGDPSDVKVMQLSDGAKVSFPVNGCLPESRKAIYGDLETLVQLNYEPFRLLNDLADRLESDQRYLSAEDAWVECMKAKDYEYSDPDVVVDELTDEYSRLGASEQLRNKEIEVAVTDANCALQVKIVDTVIAVKQEYVTKMTPEDTRLALQLNELQKSAEERAKTILSDSSFSVR